MTVTADGRPLSVALPSRSSAMSGATMIAAIYPVDDRPALAKSAVMAARRVRVETADSMRGGVLVSPSGYGCTTCQRPRRCRGTPFQRIGPAESRKRNFMARRKSREGVRAVWPCTRGKHYSRPAWGCFTSRSLLRAHRMHPTTTGSVTWRAKHWPQRTV